MKVIYYHIDELNRDSIVASGLFKICKKNNWILIIGNRNTMKLLARFEDIFDLIILPKPHFIRILLENARHESLQSKFLILYTENIGILVNDKFPDLVLNAALGEEFMSGNSTYVDMVTAFCFWGVKSKNCVTDHYPELESKCHVVGHPRHDRICLKVSDKLFKHKKNIGIVTRFFTLNDYMLRHPLSLIHERQKQGQIKYEFFNKKTGHYLKSERRGVDIATDIFLDAVDYQNLYQIITTLVRYNFNVSIKIHPRENINTYNILLNSIKNNISVVESFMPFNHWVADQQVIIGPPSTCFYDAILLGTTPISIANLSPQRPKLIQAMDEDSNCLIPFIFAPDTIEQLMEFLESNIEKSKTKFLINDQIKKVLTEESNFPHQSNSLDRLASVIRDTIAEAPPNFYRITRYLLFRFIFVCKTEYSFLKHKILKRISLNSTNFHLTLKIRKKIKELT